MILAPFETEPFETIPRADTLVSKCRKIVLILGVGYPPPFESSGPLSSTEMPQATNGHQLDEQNGIKKVAGAQLLGSSEAEASNMHMRSRDMKAGMSV